MSYVYRHIRLDNNEVFYVGIGSDDNYSRAKNKRLRNPFWHRIVEKSAYEVEILFDELTREEALAKEIEFIKIYGRRDLGLGTLVNLSNGGDGGGKGWMPTEEVRQKMRDASAKRNLTPELRSKFATGKGRVRGEEERKKLSDAHKGKPKSEEHRKNLSKAKIGIRPNEETRLKLSQSHKGLIRSEETRKKLSEAHKGKKHSIEHRLNNEKANYRFNLNQILQIKELHKSGLSNLKIAKVFGCSSAAIWLIVNNKSYKHIAA